LNTTLPNEIGHNAQERALLLEVVLNVQQHCAQNVLGTSLNIGHQCRALLGKIVASLLVPRKDVSQKIYSEIYFSFRCKCDFGCGDNIMHA
jgi:hypothetical protein